MAERGTDRDYRLITFAVDLDTYAKFEHKSKKRGFKKPSDLARTLFYDYADKLPAIPDKKPSDAKKRR